jgi:excisionase family DNA binding protein
MEAMPYTLTVAMARMRHPAVGKNRLYAALASGALSSARVGRRIAIPVTALDAWVMSGCPVSRED